MKCTIDTCDRDAVARGWCVNHYYAWRKHGDPRKVIVKQHHGKSLRERFDIYTKRGEGCWLWIGYLDPHGYGRLNVGNRPRLAHRISYELHFGNLPADKVLCHKCDNPRCVNPEHLFLGTQADNVADMENKGRARKRGLKGSQHGRALLTEAQVLAIRASKLSTKRLAEMYGVTVRAIQDVRGGKSWKHI